MIKKINITNIKGIGNNTDNSKFEFDISPNKPNILVAPNGFGKSSFATAFKSLNQTKIVLDKDNYFENKDENIPSISIDYENDGDVTTLVADNTSNQIKNAFDWFVINNQVYAKAKKSRINGNVIASASLETPAIILKNRIPERATFNYTVNSSRDVFGNNGKILRNISSLFTNRKFLVLLKEQFLFLGRINGQREQQRITQFKNRVNEQNGSAEQVRNWIDNNELDFLRGTQNLSSVATFISSFDLSYTTEADNFLTALQIAECYNNNQQAFKNALERKVYELEKTVYSRIFDDFNSSWKAFRPVEKEGKYIIEIPKASHISNGQRDVMCFIALLKKAELQLIKKNSILIIDEVFDYLDDANLIAVQYYITKLIKKFQQAEKKLYPIILTHLNPYYFKNFTFSKQKVTFLDKRDAKINVQFKKLLQTRGDEQIKDNVSKYHLHFEPVSIDIRPDFEALNLKPTWGDSSVFDNFVHSEFDKYKNGESEYDPFAVCCSVRKKVEKYAYDKINDPELKQELLNTHTTPAKLQFTEEKGYEIPETFYLLGIIYNDGMHWKNNEVAIAAKLENRTIRKMIEEISKN